LKERLELKLHSAPSVPRALDLKVGALVCRTKDDRGKTLIALIQVEHNEHPRYGLSDSKAVR
jgi:hypothetical protein